MMLIQGKTEEAARTIDEALSIDRLNGYRFEAIHLVYRATYLGMAGKLDEAMDSSNQAIAKALTIEDAYSFIMAENAYATGLVQKGKEDEAIEDLSLLQQGKLQKFTPDAQRQACLASALELPILHLTLLEDLANKLDLTKHKDQELEVWLESYDYGRDHNVSLVEAEAADNVGDLYNQSKDTDNALKYYAIAADLYRKLHDEPLLTHVEISQSLLLIHANRGKEALVLEQEVASYAERYSLRSQEFIAYGVLSEIYQPAGDLERARDTLEKALSLVRPGPFDDELDNRVVLQDYLRLGDVYRALKNPIQELRAVENAFLLAVHLKDEKLQQNLVAYLDQRLKDLRIRELVTQRQKEGQLSESLFYSCVLYLRDGMPKPGGDNSNWNRIMNLPFQIARTPDGAIALTEVLNDVDSFLGFPKAALLDALARYYITNGNDAVLAEKYAMRSEEIKNVLTGNVSALKVESACVLAIAYMREVKNSLSKSKLAQCMKFANEANDEQSLKIAASADALVQIGIGAPASAKESVERLLANVPDDPEMHVELAMSLANSKLYDEAASQLNFAIGKLTSQGDTKTIALAYFRVATALNSDDSPRARELQLEYLRSGQRIFHGLNAQAEEAETLHALGQYYLNLSQSKLAIDSFENAYALAEKAGRNDMVAQALSDLGNAYQKQNDFIRAREFHEKAATAYHELKNPGMEAFCLQNLARDHALMNETDVSLSTLLEAKAVAASAPALSQYFVLVALGQFYRQQGQYEKSLAAYREAAELAKQSGDNEHCAYSHLAVAELDTIVGSWDDAVGETETALNLFQDVGDNPGQASGWAVLTGIYGERSSSLKNFDKALECYKRAQALGYGESLDLDLVEIYIQTGRYVEAAKIANVAIQQCEKDDDNDCRANVLLSLSEAQRLNGDIKAARSSLDEARPVALQSHDLYFHGRLLYGEARQLTSEGKLDEALASYQKLIALIETVRGRLNAKEQQSVSENYGYIYDELVSLLYSMSKKDSRGQLIRASQSLEYAETNKARQFAESWGRTFVDQMRRSLPASTQETERSLFAKRDRILAELNSTAVSGAVSTRDRNDNPDVALSDTQKQIDLFLQDLRSKSPHYAAVAYPEAIQISTLPLKKGETLVEFKMTDDSTLVWIVENRSGNSNELVTFYKVPQTRTWFLDRVSRLRAALNSGQPDTIDWKASEEIFSALFPSEAFAAITEAQNIVFVPDDVLFALPIELYSPNASKGEFIFLGKASTYYPSAVSFRLDRTASHQSAWQESFLGLADPITSPEDDRYVAMKAANGTFTQTSDRNSERTVANTPDKLRARGFLFERLPGTATEVRNVASLLQKTNEKVEVRVGIDATKSRLLETDLSKFRFLHFATHGVLPVDTGVKEPALILSYDGIAPDHMLLSMSEILDLKLQAESVVLSACNTGSGKISRAEGVMSLGRAFLAAGSSSVTVSLWQVSDESTAKLMERYYKGVLAGKPKSVALAEAREALFSEGYKDPFFWAPFILIGE
jgi:CHAT domain-containing protein/cytochrome c-type biogenesis protein CcmH/NrfG